MQYDQLVELWAVVSEWCTHSPCQKPSPCEALAMDPSTLRTKNSFAYHARRSVSNQIAAAIHDAFQAASSTLSRASRRSPKSCAEIQTTARATRIAPPAQRRIRRRRRCSRSIEGTVAELPVSTIARKPQFPAWSGWQV